MKTYKQWLEGEKEFKVSFLRDITDKELKRMYRTYQLMQHISPLKRLWIEILITLEN